MARRGFRISKRINLNNINMKVIKYPKTPQFRNIISEISHQANYVGQDEYDTPRYDVTREKPTLVFTGTVKLHGTNASITYNPFDGVTTQSRNSRFDSTNLNSHMGFTQYVLSTHKEFFNTMMRNLFTLCGLDAVNDTLVLYGEWAGNGVQKNVAISQAPKAFYAFALKVRSGDCEGTWLDNMSIVESSSEHNFYNLHELWTRKITIDFNNPSLSTNELIEYTNLVEKECPIASLLYGISGIGEGIVWSTFYNNQRLTFKVKGEKHSASKVKTLAEVDPIKIKAISDFVDYAVTPNRVAQGIQESNPTMDIKKTGDFISWVINDILSEEADVLHTNNLEWKEVAKNVSTRARQLLFDYMDKENNLY